VVIPPIPCEQSKEKKDRMTLGKIIKKSYGGIELKLTTIIKAIPGYTRYYLVQEKDDCSPTNFAKARETLPKECTTLRETPSKDLFQLLSPYGGITIERITITPKFDFMAILRHLLEGVAKLNAQGICHYDLHRGNVVVDIHGTARIIDFGSAFIGDTVTEAEASKHFYVFSSGVVHSPVPPELAVQNGIHDGLSIAHSIQITMEQKQIFRTAQSLLRMSIHKQKLDIINFWETEQTWKGEGWAAFFRAYWRTWDAFAVGVMMTDLLKKCFLLPWFIEKTWTVHQDSITKVLTGLLQGDPRKRLTAEKALALLG
jgi:serine/threonine protein kinase